MIPLGYSRNVIHGVLPGGEIFQCGLWAAEAPSDQAATQSQADAFQADLTTQWAVGNGPKYLMTTGTTVTGVTVYSYTVAGGKAEFVAESACSLSGMTGTQNLPDQVAVCASLETGHAGRRNRGRIYWPATAIAASSLSGGQLIQSECSNQASWWVALIRAWNAHLAGNGICVLSQVAGSSNPVTSVRVDSRLDIQRRRANRETINASATATV